MGLYVTLQLNCQEYKKKYNDDSCQRDVTIQLWMETIMITFDF